LLRPSPDQPAPPRARRAGDRQSGRGGFHFRRCRQPLHRNRRSLWCAALGFSASERIARVAYEASIDLAAKLIQIAPVPMSKVLFKCSGSEPNDTAIKLAWYYQAAMGRPQKNKIIGRRNGYHGNTVAAVSVSGKPDMHADFGLPLPMMRHTEFPHYYRGHEE